MNPQNKKQLVRVVTEELQKEGFRQRLTGEHLCTTTEESCVEISADYFQTKRRSDVNSRGSRHQTSCSRISCSHEWFQDCCYIIRRYDVFVLCLAFKDSVLATMYLKCGTQTPTRFVSITNVLECHGFR